MLTVRRILAAPEPRWPPSVVATVQTISEAQLLPITEQMLAQFPFYWVSTADNGSEFVNHAVARMIEKLCSEFTSSRAAASGTAVEVRRLGSRLSSADARYRCKMIGADVE
jgi:hypothetical protein